MSDRDCTVREIEVIARGLVIEDDRILVCRNVSAGHRYLPGGHVEPGEAARDAVRREFLEECGEEVHVGPCVLVMEGLFAQQSRARHEIVVVFHVQRTDSGEVRSMESKLAFEWLAAQELAAADFRPAALATWLTLPSTDRPAWMSYDARPA